MIRLKASLEPMRIPLGRDVFVTLRPATSIEHLHADAKAREQMRQLSEGVRTFDEIGAPVHIADRLVDPAFAVGVADLLMSIALFEMLVTSWEGVGTAAGDPAPLERAHIAALLLDGQFLRRFQAHAYGELLAEQNEGKKSEPSSPGGSGAGGPPIASDAEPPTSPVAAASGAKTGSAALRSSTSPAALRETRPSLH